jgi:hypothetical protein
MATLCRSRFLGCIPLALLVGGGVERGAVPSSRVRLLRVSLAFLIASRPLGDEFGQATTGETVGVAHAGDGPLGMEGEHRCASLSDDAGMVGDCHELQVPELFGVRDELTAPLLHTAHDTTSRSFSM